jgi:hypothetical protein
MCGQRDQGVPRGLEEPRVRDLVQYGSRKASLEEGYLS